MIGGDDMRKLLIISVLIVSVFALQGCMSIGKAVYDVARDNYQAKKSNNASSAYRKSGIQNASVAQTTYVTKVKKAQKILGLKVDGIFGGRTVGAIRYWQRKNGFLPNGNLDSFLNQIGN